ncbi:16S rRNA (cytosine967-C5)-methyltransferase [Streptohalobacillus salinus]|uniref:16S rRNA (cytosine(967)-C(5))-methyltransferase n=1 Tax=Streptohalobacillus salinus TaxID=621096 RepID=A0A2V3WCU1_9BACI|nr:16S rRNA (cytosine(967)-C(5))-methyltransferase RsmB [Streptohalobacillus salinus]PXW92576.1 16S rRNA (cytosine967-C5)-methyltransferase [Streptohalobacillus salinus]
MTKKTVRNHALDVLTKVGDGGGFSHLIIDQTIKKANLNNKDVALLTEIVYGTLNRKLTLAYDLKQFVKKENKLQSWVKWLLYLSFYQMKYLNKVPDHAIINEAVEIAKQRGHQGIVKLVNGVLRTAQRNGFTDYSEIEDAYERLAIETSTPRWLIERWDDSYGLEKAEAIARQNLAHQAMSIRVNPLRISREEAIEQLRSDGFEVSPSLFSNQGIVIEKGNVLTHDLFTQGAVTIQDQSSMLVTEMMQIEDDQMVLDACSAPGGKTTHIAEKLHNTGEVHAFDIHEKKMRVVKEKAETLGLINIKTASKDARLLTENYPPETFDRILIDAPCSGLGVIRTKPDIKYSKTENDIDNLAIIQFELLTKIAPLIKKDGMIVYSTCTVDPTENEVIIAEFLTSHQAFEVDPSFFETLPVQLKDSVGITEFGLQIFPDDFNTDGFFMTRLRRREDDGQLGNILS